MPAQSHHVARTITPPTHLITTLGYLSNLVGFAKAREPQTIEKELSTVYEVLGKHITPAPDFGEVPSGQKALEFKQRVMDVTQATINEALLSRANQIASIPARDTEQLLRYADLGLVSANTAQLLLKRTNVDEVLFGSHLEDLLQYLIMRPYGEISADLEDRVQQALSFFGQPADYSNKIPVNDVKKPAEGLAELRRAIEHDVSLLTLKKPAWWNLGPEGLTYSLLAEATEIGLFSRELLDDMKKTIQERSDLTFLRLSTAMTLDRAKWGAGFSAFFILIGTLATLFGINVSDPSFTTAGVMAQIIGGIISVGVVRDLHEAHKKLSESTATFDTSTALFVELS